MLPPMVQEVFHGSTKEENVALPHPPAEGGGYEDAAGSHSHLRSVRKPETPAPRLHRPGGLRHLPRSNGRGNLLLRPVPAGADSLGR